MKTGHPCIFEYFLINNPTNLALRSLTRIFWIFFWIFEYFLINIPTNLAQLNEEFEESTPDGRQAVTLHWHCILHSITFFWCGTSTPSYYQIHSCLSYHHSIIYPQVKSLVTFEDGKIVCVQKAVKEGQKSTKVRGNLMIIGTLVIMIMIMTIIWSWRQWQSSQFHPNLKLTKMKN